MPSDDQREDDRRTSAGSAPSSARLDRVAAELRRTPLVVDPEVGYVLDASQRRSLIRTLRDARVAVFVAVLPKVDEDESGGDTQRVLQTLQRRVGRTGVYVTVDEEGGMDLASVGVPLDLSIPYELLFPPRDERPAEQQASDPAPPGWTTVPDRLRTIVATVRKAGAGPPNGVIDDVDPLRPLSGTFRAARNREDAVAAGVTGTLLGLLVAGTFLGIRAAVRRPLAAGGGGRGGRSGPTPGGGPGRGGRPAGGSRRKRGGRSGGGRP
ncbi:hypothetical protein AB0L40_23335 [Patulibacter sp. NPDC049589]|uniref:hypothetical protein n=1 Tax=Patulibacter sp. NPDC049589 TaxID=3154731 RepID=UPI003439C8DC